MTGITIGASGDITLVNVTVEEFSPDNLWVRVALQPDPVTGDIVNVWLPLDARTNVNPSLPANWPPQDGDIWTVQGTTLLAAVMSDNANHKFFVSPTNVQLKQTPPTVEQALARYGSKLELLTRIPPPTP